MVPTSSQRVPPRYDCYSSFQELAASSIFAELLSMWHEQQGKVDSGLRDMVARHLAGTFGFDCSALDEQDWQALLGCIWEADYYGRVSRREAWHKLDRTFLAIHKQLKRSKP